MRLHPDAYRAIDRQPDAEQYVKSLELRGRAPSHAGLRRRFLRFAGVRPGWRVLEVGCGTGVVCRDLAGLVGPRGHVTGVDPSRVLVSSARQLAQDHGLGGRIDFRVGDGTRLKLARDRFDCALAVTVLLHVPRPELVVRELARVTRPGGIVGVQDQDFATQVLNHPDRALTRRIFEGVAARTYPEPWSGRTLVPQLVRAGLSRIRLHTDVYEDITLEPFTRALLERRAANAVRFGLVSSSAAARWLQEIERLAAVGEFVFTMNFYGVTGVKSRASC